MEVFLPLDACHDLGLGGWKLHPHVTGASKLKPTKDYDKSHIGNSWKLCLFTPLSGIVRYAMSAHLFNNSKK